MIAKESLHSDIYWGPQWGCMGTQRYDGVEWYLFAGSAQVWHKRVRSIGAEATAIQISLKIKETHRV